MKRGMAVLRSACLALGLLMAVGGSAWAQCTCTLGGMPVTCSALNFGGGLIGNPIVLSVTVTAPNATVTATASISGPNTPEFSILSPAGGDCGTLMPNATCNITVAFVPQGCGTRMATLTVTFCTAGGPMGCSVIIPLVGFGCSFDCAIFATQTGIATNTLSTTGGNTILRELILAQATGGTTRCFHLNCALCLAQTELARGRTGAQAVIDQIICLLQVFCATIHDFSR